jgi:cytochrome c oxidase assembly factor CtaG
VAGVAALTLPLVSPLDAIADGYLLSAHMLQHLLLLDVGPALLMLALRGPLLFFFLPAAVLAPLAGIRPLRRCLGVLVRPSVAFLLWTVAVATWHVPAVYDYAVGHGAVHQLEHLSFVVVGCLVWSQLIDPARRGALSVPAGRVFYALGLIAVGHAVVHPILFGGGALYHPYLHQPHRLLGLSPLADQHWAGIVMTIDQVLTMGVCVAYLLWRDARRTRPRRVAGATESRTSAPAGTGSGR